MSYDSTNKPGKRKLTTQKGKTKSPTPPPLEETLPGTSVNLDAYIWQENLEAGLVVMNVKWRGKTYCGAFIDIEKHNWQPPRIGESLSPEADHFTRGKNKRSLNSESSERGDDDTPTKRGRNKGKKKRGPIPMVKKLKKNATDISGEPRTGPQSPSNSVTSTDDRKSVEPEEIKKEPETPKPEEKKEEEPAEDKTKTVKCKAPDTPILPDLSEPNAQSVINNYSPHSKKLKTSNATVTSNKLTPIPKELYGSDSVIRSFCSKSPINMMKPELLQAPVDAPIKPFLNPSPRNLGCVLPGNAVSRSNNMYHVDPETSASKPQVIVKPERREIRNEMVWNKTSMSLPVLKPQPHFTSPDMRPNLHGLVSSTGGHHGLVSSVGSIMHPGLVSSAGLHPNLHSGGLVSSAGIHQPHHAPGLVSSSSLHPSLHTPSGLANLVGGAPSFYKDPKKNEQYLPFKGADHQMGHAFKNASMFGALKPSGGMDYPFSNLHRHFYQSTIEAACGDKTEEQGGSTEHHHPTNQEAAQSLLQLSRPFSPKTTPLDQLHYLSRLGSMPNTMMQHPAPYPPPRFPPESKEDIAKIMSFQSMGPKFPLVGKFR